MRDGRHPNPEEHDVTHEEAEDESPHEVLVGPGRSEGSHVRMMISAAASEGAVGREGAGKRALAVGVIVVVPAGDGVARSEEEARMRPAERARAGRVRAPPSSRPGDDGQQERVARVKVQSKLRVGSLFFRFEINRSDWRHEAGFFG